MKKTNGGWKYELYAGLVSGNKECGVAGAKIIFFLLKDERIMFSQSLQTFCQAAVVRSLFPIRKIIMRRGQVVSNNVTQESAPPREFTWESGGLKSTSLNANV